MDVQTASRRGAQDGTESVKKQLTAQQQALLAQSRKAVDKVRARQQLTTGGPKPSGFDLSKLTTAKQKELQAKLLAARIAAGVQSAKVQAGLAGGGKGKGFNIAGMQAAAAKANQVRDRAAVIAAAGARKRALEDEKEATAEAPSKGKNITAFAQRVAAARKK